MKQSEKEWTEARGNWLNTDDKTLDTMKEQPIVKKINEFAFSKIYSSSSWTSNKYNFFYIISDENVELIGQNLKKLKTVLFEDLIKHFITVFDASSDTYKLCKYVFDIIGDKTLKNEALAILEQSKENGKFDPKTV